MKCIYCGTENVDNAKFCMECGRKIVMVKYCPQCGAPSEGGKFCAECGAALDDSYALEKTYNVVLKSVGFRKIDVVDVVRSYTGFGLVDAKAAVERGGVIIKNLSKADAESAVKDLKAAGAAADIE